jgi:cytochrome b561
MTRTTHDPITRSIHWIIAVLVATAYGVALVREDLPKGDLRTFLLAFHMWIGMGVFLLSIARLGWRAAAPAVEPAPGTPPMRLLARAAHVALYLALLALPLVGLLAAWGKGRPVTLFGLMPLAPLVPIDRGLGERLEDLHQLAGHAVMILAGLHAAAAIAHQWVLKDGTLARMLPLVRGRATSAAE